MNFRNIFTLNDWKFREFLLVVVTIQVLISFLQKEPIIDNSIIGILRLHRLTRTKALNNRRLFLPTVSTARLFYDMLIAQLHNLPQSYAFFAFAAIFSSLIFILILIHISHLIVLVTPKKEASILIVASSFSGSVINYVY